MKFNYQIIIEYSGADYVGWQFQKNGKSIQSVIEKALYKIFKKKVKIIGSGRTDAGVNAWGQSANFYLNHKCPTYTIETPSEFDLQLRIEAQKAMIQKALSLY